MPISEPKLKQIHSSGLWKRSKKGIGQIAITCWINFRARKFTKFISKYELVTRFLINPTACACWTNFGARNSLKKCPKMSPGSRFQTDPKTITCCYLLYWWGQFFLHFWRKLLLPFHFVPLQHIFVRAPQKNTSQKYVGTVFPRFWRELLKNLTINNDKEFRKSLWWKNLLNAYQQCQNKKVYLWKQI